MGYTEFCMSYILRKLPNCRQSAQNLTQDNFKLNIVLFKYLFFLPTTFLL